MGQYRKKPVVIEAINFDEFIDHAHKFIKENPTEGNYGFDSNIPWHFKYKGHPITHENDDCYLIPTHQGTVRFNRGDVLITQIDGEIYPCKLELFINTYEAV